MKKLQQYARVAVLRKQRTEQAKAIRRKYGDASGKCLFKDCILRPVFDGCSNTITSITKDNLLLIEYEERDAHECLDELDDQGVLILHPINTTRDGCAATITAKYEHIGCNDILSLAHFPRTIILIEYRI